MALHSRRRAVLAAAAAAAFLGWGLTASPVQAQHGGYHHDDDDGPRHGPRFRFGPGAIEFDGGYRHHRRRHHSHCREIEYHDRYGRHRVRTECDD